MIFRTAATSAALAIALAIIGAAAGPQWDPVPVGEHLKPESSDTAIGGQVPGEVDPVGTYEVRETEVTVQLDGVSVDALIREPVDAPGLRPGVVFIHGAGTGKDTGAFVEIAGELASAGIVTMVPSKRLDTYSTRHRNYVSMAKDYQHSVDLLRTRPSVDPGRVGLYAESEGNWIAPVMAAADPSLAFTAMISAPVVPPRQQAAFAVDAYLRNTDVPHSVFRAIPRAVGMELPGGGFEYADFDVQPYQRKMTAPILVVYGTADPSMPIEQGARQIIADAGSNGNDDVTVRFYAGANHGIRVDGHVDPDFARDLSAWVQSLPAIADAAPRIAGDQPSQQFLASPVPSPRWYGNGDLVIGLVIAAGALLVVGPVAWLLTAAVRRTRRREVSGKLAPGLRVPLVGLAVGSVVTVVGLVVYLVAVARLALDYEKDAWVVQGGWVAVRLLGLATVVAAAMILNRLLDLRAHRRALRTGTPPTAAHTARAHAVDARIARVRAAHAPEGRKGSGDRGSGSEAQPMVKAAQGIPAQVTLWGMLAGSTILLLTLAYWGVYQLGI